MAGRASDPAARFAIECLPCIVGHWGQPVALPVETVDARRCVSLCAFAPWVNKVLCGKARGVCGDVVARFIAEVYGALGYEALAGSGDDETGGGSCLDTGGGSCLDKGRAAMGLDEDSDQEALLCASEGDAGSVRRRRAPPPVWTTVVVRGKEMTLCRRARGKGLLFPIDGPDLPAALALLDADMATTHALQPSPTKRQRADRTAVDLLEEDKGRVLWLPSQNSWQVVWQDADGGTRRTKRHLTLAEVDAGGRRLSEGEREDVRRTLLLAARRKWNEMDRSKRARYGPELCEAPETS